MPRPCLSVNFFYDVGQPAGPGSLLRNSGNRRHFWNSVAQRRLRIALLQDWSNTQQLPQIQSVQE
jgi:hypothetical protein